MATTVLDEAELDDRTAMLAGFVDAAAECVRLRNFASAFALAAGLRLTPVYRLQRENAKLSAGHRAALKSLCELCAAARKPRAATRR